MDYSLRVPGNVLEQRITDCLNKGGGEIYSVDEVVFSYYCRKNERERFFRVIHWVLSDHLRSIYLQTFKHLCLSINNFPGKFLHCCHRTDHAHSVGENFFVMIRTMALAYSGHTQLDTVRTKPLFNSSLTAGWEGDKTSRCLQAKTLTIPCEYRAANTLSTYS